MVTDVPAVNWTVERFGFHVLAIGFFCQVDFWLVFAKQSADLLDGDSVCVFPDGELVNLPGTSFCVFCIEIWNIFRGTLA